MVGNPKETLPILKERDSQALSKGHALSNGNVIGHLPGSLVKSLQSRAGTDPEPAAAVASRPCDNLGWQPRGIVPTGAKAGNLSCRGVKAVETVLGREPQGIATILRNMHDRPTESADWRKCLGARIEAVEKLVASHP